MSPLFERRAIILENVPPSRCTCSCRRCDHEVLRPSVHRVAWSDPTVAAGRVRRALVELDGDVDTLVVAPRGEATLDRHLGRLLEALRAFDRTVVVFTNGTLLHRDDVRRELRAADEVVVDVDCADGATWRALRHPTAERSFALVQQGLRIFPASFDGRIATTTHLVEGVNTSLAQLTALAELSVELKAQETYLVSGDEAPGAARRQRAAEIFREAGLSVRRTDPLVAASTRLHLGDGPPRLRPGRTLETVAYSA